jgi:uncharacterized protein (TIGR02147 family)
MNTIFHYSDYRKFLAEYYQYRKLTQKGFSHRSFLKKAGISGPSFLKDVIEGRKNLSTGGIRKFAKALDLSKEESGYFRSLVLFNQEKKPALKQRLFLKVSSFTQNSGVYTLRKDQFEYFSRWYNVAVREYIHSHEFLDDYKALAAAISPKITIQQAWNAVTLLKKLNLIKQGYSGFYYVTDPIVTFDAELENMAAHRLHKSMQAISSRALDIVPKQDRYFRTIIGSFSENAFQKIRMELDMTRKRVLEIIKDDTDAKKVYHLGMQLYKMEKNGKKGSAEGV